MEHFGIYSPVLGLRRDFPSILLNKAFTPECSNVRLYNGEIQTAKLRHKELVEKAYTVGTVTASSGSATITGSGTAWHKGLIGRIFKCQNKVHTIANTSGTAQITLDSAYTGAGGSGLSYSIGTDDPSDELNFLKKVPAPDGFPFMKYHRHISGSGTNFLLGFTKTHIYKWHTQTSAWYQLFEGAECTTWGVGSFNGGVAATNDHDEPIWWDGETDAFELLGDPVNGAVVASGVSITRAKCLTVFENHIILGNYATSDGDFYPYSFCCCNLDDETDWLQDGTTDAASFFVEGDGSVQGFGVKNELMYVFKERTTRFYWYSGSPFIFSGKTYSWDIGCMAMDSIVSANNNLYFYASDLTFREVDLGVISQAIIDIALAVNQSQLHLVKSIFVVEEGSIEWAIPYSSTTVNNKVVCFIDAEKKWIVKDVAVTAFGKWTRQTTMDWLDLYIYDGWDKWNWDNWLTAQGEAGFLFDICSDANGNTYLWHDTYTDDDQSLVSSFVLTTDFGDTQLLRYYKRVLRSLVYVRKEQAGELSIYFKRDNESGWQLAGAVSLEGDKEVLIQEIPIDYRAKSFLIKGEANCKFRFLGIEFDYNLSGLR